MMHNTSRLLIINNDKQECKTLEDLLLPNHYELIFATDGKEGLKRATELMPDLILLDVMNLTQDGFDICQQLRSEPQLSEIALLMFIPLEDKQTRLQGLKAGADDFLASPSRTEAT